MSYVCPCCGFPDLREPPRSKSGGGSYEICPSCGFQFGVSDDDDGFTCVQWRARWQKAGMPWSSKGTTPPRCWNPAANLAALKKSGSTVSSRRSKQHSPKPEQ